MVALLDFFRRLSSTPEPTGFPDADGVDTPSASYEAMMVDRPLIDALNGGTRTMRLGRGEWLAAEERESDVAYGVRLSGSVLYGAYSDTKGRLASKPFVKPVGLENAEGLDEHLAEILGDTDGQGQDLTQFSRGMLDDALDRGLTHVFVDYPDTASTAMPGESELERRQRINKQVERDFGIRAYFVHIKAADLIGAESMDEGGGRKRLTKVRFRESKVEKDGEWGEVIVQFVRVVWETRWALYRKDPKTEKWALSKSGKNTLGVIPLVTFYVSRTGFMSATPPLRELAWLNLAHYQSDSQQRNILRAARFANLVITGLSEEDAEKDVVIGPFKVHRITSPEARVYYAEHTGASITCGERDIAALEARMEVVGLAPLMERTASSTATGRAIDNSDTQCDLQAWIRSLERALRQCYEFAAAWVKSDLPLDFEVNIFNEFGITVRASEDIRNLIAAWTAGAISHRTLLLELRRRQLLSDAVDPDAEIEAVKQEAPVNGMTGMDEEEGTPPSNDPGGVRKAA